MSTGTLLATIDRTWDQRAEQRERLADVREELKARARRTNERVVEVLAKRPRGVVASPTDLLVTKETEQTIAPHCED